MLCAAQFAIAQQVSHKSPTPAVLVASDEQQTVDRPVSQVEVVNFPATQPVSGSIACSNLPLDEDGNVRVGSAEHEPRSQTLLVFEGSQPITGGDGCYRSDAIDASAFELVGIAAFGAGGIVTSPEWRWASTEPWIGHAPDARGATNAWGPTMFQFVQGPEVRIVVCPTGSAATVTRVLVQ